MSVYTKYYRRGTDHLGYLIHTSKAAQGHEPATGFVYRVGPKKWAVEDSNDCGLYTGTSRKAAVDAMYAARAIQAEADKDAEQATKLRDQFYAEMARLEKIQVSFLSTASHALMSGQENADDTVREGGVVADSAAYWELAWSGYQSHMDELNADDRELAETHNLDDLARCCLCGTAVVDPEWDEDGQYCDECYETRDGDEDA